MKNWFDALLLSQFPMVAGLPSYGLLTWMCLASLLYHRHWILENFMVNHVVHCCSVVLRDAAVIKRCNANPNLVHVSYPWNDHGQKKNLLFKCYHSKTIPYKEDPH